MTSDKHSKSPLILLGALVLAAIAALTIAATTTKARAQTPLQIYGGVNAGYGFANTDATVSSGATSAAIEGLGAQGKMYGLHAGVDMGLPNSAWFVGAFGDFNWQDVDFSAGIPGVAGIKAKLGDSWTVGSRVGLASGKTKYYGLLGYTQTDFSVSPTGFAIPPTIKLPSNFTGITYGVGVSHSLANNLALGVEARYTHYNSAAIDLGALPLTASLQPDALSIMAKLSIQLGNAPAPAAAPLK